MIVAKFGGTSLATADRVWSAVERIEALQHEDESLVVVSAIGGTTDILSAALTAALGGHTDHANTAAALRAEHAPIVASLPEDARMESEAIIEREFALAVRRLAACGELRSCPAPVEAAVLLSGEIVAARLIALHLAAAGLDAHDVGVGPVAVTRGDGGVHVDLSATARRLESLRRRERVLVVGGFGGVDDHGDLHLLGRGGSDTSATSIAAATDAQRVELWKDVDGIRSLDPRLDPASATLPRLHWAEAGALARLGSQVLHEASIAVAETRRIPIWVRRTGGDATTGTDIGPWRRRGEPLRVVVPDLARVRLAPGTSVGALPTLPGRAWVVGQLATGLEIVLPDAEAGRLAEVAGATRLPDPVTLVGLVHLDWTDDPGEAADAFAAMIEQGPVLSHWNQGDPWMWFAFTGAVDRDRIRAASSSSIAPSRRVVIIGATGTVGREVVARLDAWGVSTAVAALVNSTAAVRPRPAERLVDAAARLERADEYDRARRTAVLGELDRAQGSSRIVVDVTASEDIAARTVHWLDAGHQVVAANKLAPSASGDAWLRLVAHAHDGRYLAETTVGAALPVHRLIGTLDAAGDPVRSVEAVLAGSLHAILDRAHAGESIPDAVEAAREAGLTEPDPRDDLRGEDVRRKLVIVLRLAGVPIQPDEVTVEPLVSDAESLEEAERRWRPLLDIARVDGARWVYLARWDDHGARVRPVRVDRDHPAAGLRGPGNVVIVRTDAHDALPIVVSGAGAGPEWTAAGIVQGTHDLLVRSAVAVSAPAPVGSGVAMAF